MSSAIVIISALRWYRTHQHMSKKLPSFDMLKIAHNSSSLTKIAGPYRAF